MTPRYYDPIREDLDQRREMIKRELAQEGKLVDDDKDRNFHAGQSPQIKGAFSRRKPTSNRSASLLQLTLMTSLVVLCFGYLEYGNNIFYALCFIIPVYAYLRWKKII